MQICRKTDVKIGVFRALQNINAILEFLHLMTLRATHGHVAEQVRYMVMK